MMHEDNTTTEFEVPTFMKTGPNETWPGQFGKYKDRPQRLNYYMSQKAIDLIYLSIWKEDQTNPKLSNETYFNKTKKTL